MKKKYCKLISNVFKQYIFLETPILVYYKASCAICVSVYILNEGEVGLLVNILLVSKNTCDVYRPWMFYSRVVGYQSKVSVA